MTTIIWLARHGETQWTVEHRFNGHRNLPLIDIGREHCQRLAIRLATQPLDAVISSTLLRSRETAEILARPHGLAVMIDKRLEEMDYGKWEGLTYEEAQSLDADLYSRWKSDPATVAPPGGETGKQVAARVFAAFEDIVYRHQGRQILIVAHKTVNRILLCRIRDLPIGNYRQSIPQEPCALNQIEIQANGETSVVPPTEIDSLLDREPRSDHDR
jgi:broad specificity phosphatase PhoE